MEGKGVQLQRSILAGLLAFPFFGGRGKPLSAAGCVRRVIAMARGEKWALSCFLIHTSVVRRILYLEISLEQVCFPSFRDRRGGVVGWRIVLGLIHEVLHSMKRSSSTLDTTGCIAPVKL